MIDGAFYQQRALACLGNKCPEERADEMQQYCYRHLEHPREGRSELFRIYYYDCPPLAASVQHPLGHEIDLSRRTGFRWNNAFIEELKRKRKFAVRMGKLNESQAEFVLKERALGEILAKQKTIDELTERDFRFEVPQKGVDMQIGLDIACLAFKRLCDQIILISGDSDFVPAAKLARDEGIDFILDPLGSYIKPDLYENIDGLRCCDDRFYSARNENAARAEAEKPKEPEMTEEERLLTEEVNREYETLDPAFKKLLDNLTI